MKKLEQRVPNLRFKGFTDDWEQRKLGETVFVNSGKDYKGLQKGNIPVYGTGGYMLSVNKYLSNKDAIGIGRKGTINNPYILKAPFWTVDTLFYAIPQNQSDIEFMNAIFQNVNWHKYDESTGVPSLSKSTINQVKVYTTSLREQAAIGSLLHKIEKTISLQQRKLDLLKQLKKGFLQKMFAEKNSKQPVLRFKGFHDDWEGRKLENSADYIRGSFPQPYGNKEWYGGTNAKPFVQVVDVNTNMRLNKKTKEQISVLAQPKSRFVPSDSIVVTLQGSIGRVAITQYDSYVDRTLLIFTKYKVPVDKYFWAYSIQNIFRIEKQKAPGGTIKTITKRALSSFEVSLPVQEEQKKIGTLLKNIDDIITSQQEEVSKLKKIKKSLLQQMFI